MGFLLITLVVFILNKRTDYTESIESIGFNGSILNLFRKSKT